jgi:AcrR family transcriptional regulator
VAEKFRKIRYEEKKYAMIQSATKAFGSIGFHGVSLEQIAAELKMTKGSLYYYFSSKEELLFAVHIESLRKVLKIINEVDKMDAPPDVKLREIIKRHIQLLTNEYEGVFMLEQEYLLPKEMFDKVKAMRRSFQNKFEKIIKKGVQQNIFKVSDVKIATKIILGSVNWALRWYSSAGKFVSAEIAQMYIDLFFLGLLSRNETVKKI